MMSQRRRRCEKVRRRRRICRCRAEGAAGAPRPYGGCRTAPAPLQGGAIVHFREFCDDIAATRRHWSWVWILLIAVYTSIALTRLTSTTAILAATVTKTVGSGTNTGGGLQAALTRHAPRLLLHLPPPFTDAALPFDQTGREDVEYLGRLKKLHTLLEPREPKALDTCFRIYRRYNKTSASIRFKPRAYQYNLTEMLDSGFNPTLRTVIIIPGYLSDEQPDWALETKDHWLALENVNVIIVGWINGNRFIYSRAVAHSKLVGRQIAIFLYYLARLHGTDIKNRSFCEKLYLVGHSLGAHIAGFVGEDFSGSIGRITGLDPAGPSFDQMDNNHRLDPSDALFVDVIHTNAGKIRYIKAASVAVGAYLARGLDKTAPWLGLGKNWLAGSTLTSALFNDTSRAWMWADAWFGIDAACGHVDYYANGGRVQPGCAEALHFCDHSRAHHLYNAILRRELHLLHSGVVGDMVGGDFGFSGGHLLAFVGGGTTKSTAASSAHQLAASCLEQSGSISPSCALPVDFVSPVSQLFASAHSSTGLPTASPKTRRLFFGTGASAPFIGDQFLVRLALAPQTQQQLAFQQQSGSNSGGSFLRADCILRVSIWASDGSSSLVDSLDLRQDNATTNDADQQLQLLAFVWTSRKLGNRQTALPSRLALSLVTSSPSNSAAAISTNLVTSRRRTIQTTAATATSTAITAPESHDECTLRLRFASAVPASRSPPLVAAIYEPIDEQEQVGANNANTNTNTNNNKSTKQQLNVLKINGGSEELAAHLAAASWSHLISLNATVATTVLTLRTVLVATTNAAPKHQHQSTSTPTIVANFK